MSAHAAGAGRESARRPFDMETVISYILISGVVLSLILLVVGATAYSLQHHNLTLAYSLPQDNLFHFIQMEILLALHGAVTAKDIIDLGIIVLMLTPYVRVAFSAVAFAFIEHNVKYTVFTLWVLAVLTYSLFIRF